MLVSVLALKNPNKSNPFTVSWHASWIHGDFPGPLKASTILMFSLIRTSKKQIFQESPFPEQLVTWRSGCLLMMWRNKLPPLVCLSWAADLNLNLLHLQQATESLSWCLFQETCLSLLRFSNLSLLEQRSLLSKAVYSLEKFGFWWISVFLLKNVQLVLVAVHGLCVLISASFRE